MQINNTLIDGIIYTSVFNPADGRKNWQDMVTAFCYAFESVEDATLLLKFVSNDAEESEKKLINYLYKLSPFKCRVVACSSHLSDEDYEKMIGSSSYYVNTSHGEGQCIPLMEFMSCGKPAIAPCDSAMADYIDESVAFVIKSSAELTHWQHDARRRYRCLQTRISWMSLVEAFQNSYQLIKESPDDYSTMSQRAIDRLQQHCSNATVTKRLGEFLEKVVSSQ